MPRPLFWSDGPNGTITDRRNVQPWPMVYVLDHPCVIQFERVSGEALDEAVGRLGSEAAVLASLDGAGLPVASVLVSRPSLDDVYLRYTGRSFSDADSEGVL